MPRTPYTIYSASAGSGKTSTLVKEYLKILLAAPSPGKFRQILAITFTNKAVNEMKTRILESLDEFSDIRRPEEASHMFPDLMTELGLSAEELQQKAGKTLKELLHNYASFDVSTIDKFTHRLIRTFAKDLKLPQNFEVVLDTDMLLDEAVGQLLAKAGEDKTLTRILVAFALEKIDSNRSWDITYDLLKIGRLLFNENHLEHIEALKEKKPDHFDTLKKNILSGINDCEQTMRLQANEILQAMGSHGLERSDFKAGYFPDFLHIFSREEYQQVNFNAQWKQDFKKENLYTKTCPDTTRNLIDSHFPDWSNRFQTIHDSFNRWSLLQNAYRNLVPLSILTAIQRELRALEKERDQLPISSFNSLISNQIKDQPAPFIYERLGERYRHYFIDEFQDTSAMQWQNLIPLIGNALEGEDTQGKTGTLLLVGDAKQAIYRWRGGRAEQFLNLINKTSNPFTISPKIHISPSNFRSHAEIVRFNNSFFSHISTFLNKPVYKDLYASGSRQHPNEKEGGLVSIRFISPEEKERDASYCSEILECIREVRSKNYAYGDVCILTRTRAQGVLIAEFLLQKNIPIVSSETLLLQNNPKVAFLMALLGYCNTPSDLEAIYTILYYLAKEGPGKHAFLWSHLNDPAPLLKSRYGFDPGYVKHASVYDSLEYAIRAFGLVEGSDAFLTFLLDEVLMVEQKEDSSITTFLEHWEMQRDRLSIVAPGAMDAIQILTIHKAKGLEFPVVLYPYANADIYNRRKEQDAMLWLPVEASEYAGFEALLLTKKKEMARYGESAARCYMAEEEKLELDAFNLLYVALTRAVEALYIVTERDLDANGNPKTASFSGLFINFLMAKGLWDSEQKSYTFGVLGKGSQKGHRLSGISVPVPHGYSYKNRPEFRIVAKSTMLWEPARQKARTRGNQIHALMALIHSHADVEMSLDILVRNGDLRPDAARALREVAGAILKHPALQPYFEEDLKVRNESEILLENGEIIRPDRIVLYGQKATLIDYKTGAKDTRHAAQLHRYAHALESMDYIVENKIIVYINEEVTPEFY